MKLKRLFCRFSIRFNTFLNTQSIALYFLTAVFLILSSARVANSRSSSVQAHSRHRNATFRKSSAPFLSLESWPEVAALSPHNVTFLDTVHELPSAIENSHRQTTYLIADSYDYDVPSIGEDYYIDLIERHPLVQCVFAKNALHASTRLSLLPLGPKWQYASHEHYGEDKEDNWQTLRELSIGLHAPTEVDISSRRGILLGHMTIAKRNVFDVILGFLLGRKRVVESRRNGIAQQVRAQLKSSLHTLRTSPVSFEQHLRLLRDHAFVISPPGNGKDCHRHWEALLTGASPIIIRDNALEKALHSLPVWWVDSYHEVTEEAYAKQRARLADQWKVANLHKLYLDWWKTFIIQSTCR